MLLNWSELKRGIALELEVDLAAVLILFYFFFLLSRVEGKALTIYCMWLENLILSSFGCSKMVVTELWKSRKSSAFNSQSHQETRCVHASTTGRQGPFIVHFPLFFF